MFIYNSGVAMEESEIRDLIDQAYAALGDGDYVRALAIGDQLAAEVPDRPAVVALRAQALLESDSPAESYDVARRAVELAPTDEHAHRLLAMAAWRNGRLAVAQEAFERAIEISNRLPVLLSDYAWFMATERGPKLAKEAAETAVEADPQSSTAWAALGLAQYRLHRRDQAEAHVRRALELNPNDIYAQSAMVTLLQDRHDDRQAEALAGMLEEHAGAEDFVAAVRDEAKRRRIGRMLVERKVDVDAPPRRPHGLFWVWVLAVATLVVLVYPLVGLKFLPIVIVLAVALLIVLHRLID
jgi:Tfp pilus assembly protein PilF